MSRSSSRSSRTFHSVLLTLCLAAGAACGDSTTEPSDSPVGVFVLTFVNGEEVPYVIGENQAGDTFEITSGEFVFREDTTCTLTIVQTVTQNDETDVNTSVETCTWDTFQSTLYVTNEDNQTQPLSWMDDRIILNVDGLGFVFVR